MVEEVAEEEPQVLVVEVVVVGLVLEDKEQPLHLVQEEQVVQLDLLL
jgi:hypothetical protein